MYADILPVQRLPRSLGVFTYAIPENLRVAVGQWVRIPFRAQTIDGIVWKLRTQRPTGVRSLRAIETIVPDVPPLTKLQVRLIESVAQHYFVSLAHALDVALPRRPKRSGTGKVRLTLASPRLSLPHSRLIRLRRWAGSAVKGAGDSFFPTANYADRVTFLSLLLSQESSSQCLVVVPTVVELERLAASLQRRFSPRLITLHPNESANRYWEAWQRVASTPAAIVLATKRGLFAPFTNLTTIVVDEETDTSHKQMDQNPRYHARSVAWTLGRLTKARLLFLDAVPSLSLSGTSVREHRRLTLPQERTIVDMTNERIRKNFSPLAEELQSVVAQSQGAVLLLTHRRGFARACVCRDCGWSAHCPNGHGALVEYRGGTLRCRRCAATQLTPGTCPQCKGVRLRGMGFGTEQVEDYVRSLKPLRPVARVDSDQPSLAAQPQIVIATEKILHLAFPPSFSAVIVVDADAYLSLPDFSTSERALQLFERVLGLAHTSARVWLQTYDPAHPVIQAVRTQSHDAFYAEELTMRKLLRLPPVTRVVKLLGHHTNAREADQSAASLRRKLGSALEGVADIEGPLPTAAHTGVSEGNQVLLLRLLSVPGAAATLQRALLALPDHWLVDVDPLTLA